MNMPFTIEDFNLHVDKTGWVNFWFGPHGVAAIVNTHFFCITGYVWIVNLEKKNPQGTNWIPPIKGLTFYAPLQHDARAFYFTPRPPEDAIKEIEEGH